jgi:hypothetical protein
LVVGRNDNYGVNLHKRTAISLNYFASLCREESDEIIYVDCNTDAHELTLVEAIADTLTAEARRRLRVFRIEGSQMKAAIGETPLPFSDELSRNAGIRRSNPANQWILSTNCDILLHPITGKSLHEVLRALPPRFYVCPRINVPIAQWQLLDRMNVPQIQDFCDAVIKQGARLPPEREQEWLRFNAVGDFQLAPRAQWFDIRGCEEAMKFWGHSDANNSKRLSLLNGGGRTPDLADYFRILHLDHTPSLVVAHSTTMVRNDWKTWIDDVNACASHNGEEWGLSNIALPEIRLNPGEHNPEAILKMHRRPRRFLSSLAVRLRARLWAVASRVVNRFEK